MDKQIDRLLEVAASKSGPLLVLTGAGISAESGIPTFRGEEGYWTVGSQVYHPQQMATWAAFQHMPTDVWQWYLYRRTICRRAAPNPAHAALALLERALGDRCLLITQNVDGLHLRAGNSLDRTYQIHGNIDFMRCARECTTASYPLPESIGEVDREREHALTGAQIQALRCPQCGGLARPHVLWFDECYDEPHYRWDSSLRAAERAALVLIIGTSASTNLPWQVVNSATRAGAAIIDVNLEQNPFSELADRLERGASLQGRAGEIVPRMVERLIAARPEAAEA